MGLVRDFNVEGISCQIAIKLFFPLGAVPEYLQSLFSPVFHGHLPWHNTIKKITSSVAKHATYVVIFILTERSIAVN